MTIRPRAHRYCYGRADAQTSQNVRNVKRARHCIYNIPSCSGQVVLAVISISDVIQIENCLRSSEDNAHRAGGGAETAADLIPMIDYLGERSYKRTFLPRPDISSKNSFNAPADLPKVANN